MGKISSPSPIHPDYSLHEFDCGDEVLNEWLKRRALKNENAGASRTFVVTVERRVIGYYALATGSVERLVAPKSVSRNMPEPIPVMVLGRLAIDRSFHSQGLGSGLLRDAVLRTVLVSHNVGVRALLVHAISEDAKRFYQRYDFVESPLDPLTLMLPLNKIAQP